MTAFKMHIANAWLLKLWEEIKDSLADVANIPSKYKEEIYHQTKWELIRDTRRKSQVIDNKPRHLIKKII